MVEKLFKKKYFKFGFKIKKNYFPSSTKYCSYLEFILEMTNNYRTLCVFQNAASAYDIILNEYITYSWYYRFIYVWHVTWHKLTVTHAHTHILIYSFERKTAMTAKFLWFTVMWYEFLLYVLIWFAFFCYAYSWCMNEFKNSWAIIDSSWTLDNGCFL